MEAADFAVFGAILIQERKPLLVELVSKKSSIRSGPVLRPSVEIEAQDAGLTHRTWWPHRGRTSAALFRPLPDHLVIGGYMAFGHGCSPVRFRFAVSRVQASIPSMLSN
jgi:hypothetical protein